VRIRVYLQRVAVGLTAPVLIYMALSLLVPLRDERAALLAGAGWCAAVWVSYFLGVHLRELLRRPPHFDNTGPTRHA